MTPLMLILSLAAGQVPALQPPDDPSHETNAVSADQVRQWLCGESDWEPDAGVALAAAQQRLQAACRHWLTIQRPSLDARYLAPDQLNRLLARPEVLWRQDQQRRERGYGTMWRVRLDVGLGDEVIDGWASEIREQVRRRRWGILFRLTATTAGMLLAVGLVRAFDGWTRGYRRVTALLIGGGLAAIVTMAAWLG
ncbi:MAG: hypothetical protein KJ000_26755 [Pirellulaceae bacterium]|nr:hypothetical protein [Pirellulaceae bacterium]